MYKRPASRNAFQYKEPKTKMQKLDITISGASSSKATTKPINIPLPSTSKTTSNSNDTVNAPSSSSASSHNKPSATSPPQKTNLSPNNDLWGDVDEEFILLESQNVDNLDIIGQQIIVHAMNISQCKPVEIKKKDGPDKILKDLLESDEDDRFFSELQNFDDIGTINKGVNEYFQQHQNSLISPKTPAIFQPSPSVFKVPTHNRNYKGTNPVVPSCSRNDPDISFTPTNRPQSTQFTERIEIPRPLEQIEPQTLGQNLKLKFLTQQQCDLRKEIDYLKVENQRLGDQCQIKDGESSLLRSENERLKSQFDITRREKSSEIAKIKSEQAVKMSDLEKEILALKSQLQFKEMSTKQMQFRKFNYSQSSQSMTNATSEEYAQSWEKFKLAKKTYFPPKDVQPVDPHIYISSTLSNSGWAPTYDRKQLEYLNRLQHVIADMMKQKELSKNGHSRMLEEAFDLALLSAKEMHSSSICTTLRKKKFSYAHSEIGIDKEYSIVTENWLFPNEKSFVARRILICLATISDQFPEFSSMLFRVTNQSDDNESVQSFMNYLSLTLENFCYYKNIANVQGMVESSCILLNSLAINCDITSLERASTTVTVLHNILLCRPEIRSLVIISKFLQLISYCQTNNVLNALCVNKRSPDIVEPLRLITYTSDICTLQLYALLIRLFFLPHEKSKFTIKQLTAITDSTLLFIHRSFLQSPDWLFKENCLCRGRLFGAIVTLLYMCLLHWIERPNDIEFRTIKGITEFGVEFLYETLVKNYNHIFLNAGGTIIKNRLRVIVDWLNFYDFQFESVHQHAIQSICLQQLEPMVDHLRFRNTTNVFSKEASQVYESAVDSFFDDYD